MRWPDPCMVERDVTWVDPLTQDPDTQHEIFPLTGYEVQVATDGTVEILWEQDNLDTHSLYLGTPRQEGEDVVGQSIDTAVRLRPLRPSDAIRLGGAGVPQPRDVVEAHVLQGGGVVADELNAVVAPDNTVATLMLETGVGTYVRYGADWQLLSGSSEALDGLSLIPVAPSALDTWDAADAAGVTVTAFDLARQDELVTINPSQPLPEAPTELPVTAGAAVPVLAGAGDVDLAVRYATLHPDTRWYVIRRAETLGQLHRVPMAWLTPRRMDSVLVAAAAAAVATEPEVLEQAQRYVTGDLGDDESGEIIRGILASARRHGLLGHEAVLAAVRWREWLHPRGRDGKFIEKEGDVIVTGLDGSQRRATVQEFTKQGPRLAYTDGSPDPGNGFSEIIPLDAVKSRVQVAPPKKAEFSTLSPKELTARGRRRNFATKQEYDAYVAEFAQGRDTTPSLNKRGEPIKDVNSQEYNDHIDWLNKTLKDAEDSGLATLDAYSDENGRISDERMEVLLELVDEAVREVEARGVPKDRRGLITGGLGGAGKSSTLAKLAESGAFNEKDFVTINPDEFKDRLIKAGLVPEIPGVSPAETAGLTHEESSFLAKVFTNAMLAEGYNIIHDVTMGGSGGSRLLNEFKREGYTADGLFVDIPVTSRKAGEAGALERAKGRHLGGLDKYRAGEGEGGRHVPWNIILSHQTEAGSPYLSKNRENFEALKSEFRDWVMYDNSGHRDDGYPMEISRGDSGNLPGSPLAKAPSGPGGGGESLGF